MLELDFHVRINPDYEKSMHNFHGYVEVNVGGVWGSVCNRGWTNKDAFVACKQMGYAGGYAYRPPKNSSNLILMDNVRCHGDEDSLLNCPYDKWAVTTGCDFYTKRAGVLCYNDTNNYARVLPSTLGPDGVQRRKEIRG
ncbi:neurotrypsin-like [Dreissena polymorpha]|uniref:neurotrypsin-like n=1 Tax=Dreissena polymorpha TaxID=45954 RepID=UPI002263E93C|nr:neurotrypsin-like [Dreissena polymorpha]